jgi:hypothetical protein
MAVITRVAVSLDLYHYDVIEAGGVDEDMRGSALAAAFDLEVAPAVGAMKDWNLLDLRPLSARPACDLPAAWRRLIDGFDMVVVTPSSLLGAR